MALHRLIIEDLRVCGGTSISSSIANAIFNPRFHVLAEYRIKSAAIKSNRRWLGWLALPLTYFTRACEISPYATIGHRLQLMHPIGVVIGHDAVIKDDVRIFQNVTVGSHGKLDTGPKQYPTIQSGAVLFAGACVLGAVTVGQNAVVGANAVAFDDVPAGATAVGVPARILLPRKII